MANILGDVHQVSSARKLVLEAGTVFRALGDDLGMSHVCSGLAALYEEEENVDAALKLHRKSIAYALRAHDRLGEVQSLISIGAILQETGQTAKATATLSGALEIANQINATSEREIIVSLLSDLATGQVTEDPMHD